VRDREIWLAATMVELADVRAADFDEAGYSRDLAQRLAELLSPAEITLLMSGAAGQLTVAATTSGLAVELASFEELHREGPCTSCLSSGHPCLNESLASGATPWPRFAAAARGAGFRLASALPMRRHAETVGVVGVLTAGQPLAAADARLARTLAEAATIAILQQRALRGSLARSEQLQRALDSRVVIEQAKGAVAARLGIRPDAAFELLRGYARRHNRTLTAVASAAIDGELSGLHALAGDGGATRRGRPGQSR
jgi:hypothetical protein